MSPPSLYIKIVINDYREIPESTTSLKKIFKEFSNVNMFQLSNNFGTFVEK